MNSRAIFHPGVLRAFICFALIASNTSLSACTPRKLRTAALTIEGAETVVEITVEIAETENERAQGLMHRKKLPDGEGMLFVFDRDQQLSFWMKNTFIPLSIAFITSDGRITEIRNMQPRDLTSIQSSRSVRYALEVPQGWFSRAGVNVGDVVRIDL